MRHRGVKREISQEGGFGRKISRGGIDQRAGRWGCKTLVCYVLNSYQFNEESSLILSSSGEGE